MLSVQNIVGTRHEKKFELFDFEEESPCISAEMVIRYLFIFITFL